VRELSMLEAIREALFEEMERDDRVMILGQDVGALGGVFRATDGLQQRFGEHRVVDTPLAEAVIAGAAVGLAVAGVVPVAEIQFLGFAHQAFHQIAAQLSRVRYRSAGRLHAQVTIRAPYGGMVKTPEHHSDAIEAQFVQAPGLKVVMPSTAADAKGLLLAAIRDPDPVLYCEPLRGYRLVRGPVPDEPYEVPLGSARVTRDGTDLTLIGWSMTAQLALEAAEDLEADGISTKVVDLRSLVPLDVDTVVQSVIDTGRAIVVQEAPLSAGFGAEVVATVQEEAFYDLEAPVGRVAAWDTPYPPVAVEEYYIPGRERVVAAARRLMEVVPSGAYR
jgi:pyruvate dehydrogenase E1 component beta subunit